MISISNLEKGFGDRTLFSSASFQLNPGERYGLVGANGSGKTTLLNIISGSIEPNHGQVSIPKALSLGVLKQDHFAYESEEILGVALMGNPELWSALSEKEAILAESEEDFDYERFSEL
ncbi:MAG TPA: ABC-F family ATPase, partial [Gemmatimonadetes bacterium]|nr:ABC-F family ATPase [Gemmatimonadota bacterium]